MSDGSGSKQAAGQKRTREEASDQAGVSYPGWNELVNNTFLIGQLATALQSRNAIRGQLMRADNLVDSLLGRLLQYPNAQALVDSTEREWRRVQEAHRRRGEVIRAGGPKLKKPKSGKEPVQESDPSEEHKKEPPTA